MEIDGVDLSGFGEPMTVQQLLADDCRCVTTDSGVYVVLRHSPELPRFLAVSTAATHKKDKPFLITDLEQSWLENARILYIGKAAGKKGLYQRVRQLVRYGTGKTDRHSGGRMIWHLADHLALQVRWCEWEKLRASQRETELISQFKAAHDNRRPFANRSK
jgi:hypothetical protein